MRKKIYISTLINSLGEIKDAIEKRSPKSWIEKPWVISCLSTVLGGVLGVVATLSINSYSSLQRNKIETMSMAKVFYTEVGYNRALLNPALPSLQAMLESIKDSLSIVEDVDLLFPFQKGFEAFLSKLGLFDEDARVDVFQFYLQLYFINALTEQIRDKLVQRAIHANFDHHYDELINLCDLRLRVVNELLIQADEFQARLIYKYEADDREIGTEKTYNAVRDRVWNFVMTRNSGDVFSIEEMMKEIDVEGRIAVVVALLECNKVSKIKVGMWKITN